MRCGSAVAVMAVVCVVSLLVHADSRLKGYNVDASSITVSGVSSGGFMAVQLHVAFSSFIRGVGVVAAGPFYCAQFNLEIAQGPCMAYPDLIVAKELEGITAATALSGFIDGTKNLADARVYLFSGSKDSVVHPGVVKKLKSYYEFYVGGSGSVVANYTFPAEHAWITDSWGNSCDHLGSPWINNCGYDMAGAVLKHMYGALNMRSPPLQNPQFVEFSQSEFTPGAFTNKEIGMGDTGFLFVPESCQSGNLSCKLHVSLHGCEQDFNSVQDAFIKHTGLLEWATTNNIIVLFPQAQSNLLNPKSCWDWWGYTGSAYASNVGMQMQSIHSMLNRIVFGER